MDQSAVNDIVRKGRGKAPMNRTCYLQEIDRVVQTGRYRDNWESLSSHRTPDWFCQARFGIFIHWGLYSVPAYDNEWYSRNMYIKGMKPFDYHMKTYGPHKEFGYKDFIPLFQAERFDPDAWARLFWEAGAKYVFPVAEHHDGFQMYKSALSRYNAFEMGPQRDLLNELKLAVERQGMRFCTSSHRAEHWFFMGHGREFDSDIKDPMGPQDFYWPAQPEPDNFDIHSESPSEEFLEDWLLRTCELIDNYRPSALYFDWWIQHEAFKPYLKKMAAYYYNRAEEWGREVLINYKHDAFMFGGAGVIEMERGKLGSQTSYPWQMCTSVARNSWCYTVNNDYKPTREILCDLADVVSKNGNMLLNIGPKGDGSMPCEDERILREIGAWMKINGEAIWGTRPWRRFGEGPTEVAEGMFTETNADAFTPQDFRFTVKGSCLYAIALKCPEDGTAVIRSLADLTEHERPLFHGIIKDVKVLGYSGKPVWRHDREGLTIHAPGLHSDCPVVYRVTMD